MEHGKSKRWAFFILLALTFSYFQHGGGYNQNATIGEIRELIERNTVEITRWLPITGDVSHYKGKSYSNKSPNMLFFVAPVYYAFYHGSILLGFDVNSTPYQQWATHVITFLCAGLWATLLGIMYLKLLPLLYPTLRRDDLYLLAYFFTMGTYVLPYSGSAFVHNFESFWTVAVFYRLVQLKLQPSHGNLTWLALACGVMMLANPLTVVAMPVVYWLCWRWLGGIKSLVQLSAVAVLPLLPLFTYNQLVFDFFLSGNRNHQDPAWTNPDLVMGVFGAPQFGRLRHLFGDGMRSLFPSGIFLYLGFLGAVYQFKDKINFPRWALPFPLAIFTIFLVFLLTFNGWHGGSCFGARYFMPALPFLAIASVPFFIKFKVPYSLLATWSIVIMFMAAAGTIWIDQNDFRPLKTILTSLNGQPAMTWPAFLGDAPAFYKYNLGNLLGLPGFWSLAPLAIIHALGLAYIFDAKFSFQLASSPNQSFSVLEKAMAVVVGCLVLCRLIAPEITPFINDEATIQMRISDFLGGGPLPMVGLSGSQPIPYGPIPTWIYTLIRMINNSHTAIVLGHTLTHIAAFWFFWRVQLKLFTPKIALTTTALAATSPFLFNYGRMPWDNTFLFLFAIGIVWCVVFLIDEDHPPLLKWMALGVFSGLCFATHLMTIPLIAASYLIALLYASKKRSLKQLAVHLSLSALSFFFTISPYLWAIWPTIRASTSPGGRTRWEGLSHLDIILERLNTFVSFPGFISYFFHGNEAEVLSSMAPGLRILDRIDGSALLKIMILGLVAYPLYLGLTFNLKKMRQIPPFLAYSSLTTLLVVTFYIYTGLYSHPHYYNYVWWIPFAVTGYALSLKWHLPVYLTRVVVVAILAINISFVYASGRFIVENEGIRGLGWGATAANQKRVVHEICTELKRSGKKQAHVDISHVVILPVSLQVFSQLDSECSGLSLEFTTHSDYTLKYSLDNQPPRSRLNIERNQISH